ncbi:NAD(P)-binding protein [Cylindrobasidium torrendii FP15055 ss-10]|uniref:NAD(P)-binding protein n=1 Tax=Cylindrobasidium torrendii FP15055 ss-10 TaxID=1314674 RepID=A0A0D7BF90_9AGAR|nr:NAD(P)-binding protein [Cylindrobasidium torrendii FP15055 ss-10]
MPAEKPLVLVVGSTGRIGSVVVKNILGSGNFRVAILVRKESLKKPVVQEHKNSGAELRVGDISESQEAIQKHLQGVNILISLVLAVVDQKPLLRAAKQVGTISRVVPSDFGPTAPRGVVEMLDMKRDIHEFVHELGLPFTFIEAAWWLMMLLPLPRSYMDKFLPQTQAQAQRTYAGDMHKRITISTLDSIGIFTAKILADPRTLNKSVLIHDGDMSLAEAFTYAKKVTKKDFKSEYTKIPDEVILENTRSSDFWVRLFAQYQNVIYLRNDNDLSTLAARGVLNAREMYPEIPPVDREEETRKCYEEYDHSSM